MYFTNPWTGTSSSWWVTLAPRTGRLRPQPSAETPLAYPGPTARTAAHVRRPAGQTPPSEGLVSLGYNLTEQRASSPDGHLIDPVQRMGI
jgi:hypothetical protein